MFECEKVPSKDGIAPAEPPPGVYQLAEIAEDQFQIAITSKALIHGLCGAIDGEIHQIESGFDVSFRVETPHRKCRGYGCRHQARFSHTDEPGRVEIEQRLAIVIEEHFNRIGTVASHQRG